MYVSNKSLALIFLNWLIQRHDIPHFKGLDLRNLQYEKECQKMYNTGTMTKYIYYLFKWDRRYYETEISSLTQFFYFSIN